MGIINKSRENKFKELLNRVGQGKDEENLITQGNNTDVHLSNGNIATSTSINKQSNKQKERCLNLYEKGKMKNELYRINLQKENHVKEEKVLAECTFKPVTNCALNKNKSENKQKSNGKEFYDRTVGWKKHNLEK